MSFDGQQGMFQIGISRLPENDLPDETKRYSAESIKEHISAGGMGKSTGKVERQDGYENKAKTTKRKKHRGSLKELRGAKQRGKAAGVQKRDVFWEGKAHSFSFLRKL
jgi:hypothetical protein